MSASLNVTDRTIVMAVVRLLLEGTEVVAFQYDSGFTVHFQRPLPERSGLPLQASLVLRAKWWTGDSDEVPVHMIVQSPEIFKCNLDQPYQAFKLMSFIEHNVDQVDIDAGSSLKLFLSNGDLLTIQGKETAWDFSWYLFVPSDTPGVDTWSVNCDASGNLEGAWPADAPIPPTVE